MPESSIRYRIIHRTHYRYSDSVAVCQNQLRMQPSTRPGVTCHRSEIAVLPEPMTVTEHTDYFGNCVYSFAIETLHKELTAVATSEVTVDPPSVVGESGAIPWNTIVGQPGDIRQSRSGRYVDEFCFDSPRGQKESKYADYARVSFTDGRGIVEATLDLTKRIHHDFRYDTCATEVNTPTADAFALRAGVCQDFAHIQIACLRSIGLPARYVSGYLRTIPPPGEERKIGADESHAWISVYCGPELDWIDFDPTNACQCTTDHIPICIGRDYGDVSPMRGVILGGGQTWLKVSVDVEPIQPLV
ncbi:transglutaminase family protein [Novipirellula caenicola]|uniref:Uncharacterized protein Rv2569c n=1 Tax=Novipirellula caenicola TaxID=1536901 RepID=A0ABP9VTI6_9BACT